MKRSLGVGSCWLGILLMVVLGTNLQARATQLRGEDTSSTATGPGANHSFRVAVYIPVGVVEHMRDRSWLESSWKQLSSGIKIDKVYIETYRSRVIADDALIESVKKFFVDHGVEVAGGIAYSDRDSSQFRSFSYTNPEDRAYVKHVAELTARHFDEIILDDFFFNNTKDPSDIAAKGENSWTQFRLGLMDEVSRNLVMGAARAVNPKVRIIIKFPNWYEHFQGLGYDLQEEPKIFNGIYTGTETRDPVITDQHLQQYESYEIIRYFDNVAPGHNGGGWVDTFDLRYIDRYAEQLWDTMLAKAPEIMLFNWNELLKSAPEGARESWAAQHSSFDYTAWFPPGHTPTFADVAGRALKQIDPVVGKLGKPIGLEAYKPYHSMGEDFLHNYLGMIGIPIEMTPEFPKDGKTVLLTESAKYDPQIISKMKAHLMAGGNIVITSGLLQALQDKGLNEICELRYSGRKLVPDEYWGAYGAGGGRELGRHAPVMVPEIEFLTNDAWPVIRGTDKGRGAPLLLMDRYGKGILFVLTIPDNFSDLYQLPQGVLTEIRRYLLQDLPVQMDAPSQLSLFAYDNRTFVVESFRDTSESVTIATKESGVRLRNLITGEVVDAMPLKHSDAIEDPSAMLRFQLVLKPHSYMAFELVPSH